MRYSSSWWSRFAVTFLLVFGVGLCVSPTVAYADLLDLSYNMRLAFHNRSFSEMRQQSIASANLYPSVPSASFSPNAHYSLVMGWEEYTDVHETGTGTFTESGSTSTNYNSSTTGTTSDSGYYNSTGHDYGAYDNPNTVLGDDLGYGADTYVNGTIVTNGTISTSEHGSGTGTYTGTGSSTSAVTGQNQTIGHCFWDCHPSSAIDMTGWGSSKSCSLVFSSFGTYQAGTVLRFTGIMGNCTYMTDTGAHGNCNIGNYAVWLHGGSNWQLITPNNNGVITSTIDFTEIYVVMQISNMPDKMVSFRIPYSVHMFVDLDATYTSNQISNDNNNTRQIGQDISDQTNAIGQQTQQQTNQLKDTTGANNVLDGATAAGTQIKNNVTFASQLEGVGTQLATLVASAQPSEAGFSIPSWEFQGQQIWPAMTVSVWDNIPIDIKSRVRLFNTVIFAILWLRSLWNWIASIFGFEQIDDSGGTFDDLFSDESVDTHS